MVVRGSGCRPPSSVHYVPSGGQPRKAFLRSAAASAAWWSASLTSVLLATPLDRLLPPLPASCQLGVLMGQARRAAGRRDPPGTPAGSKPECDRSFLHTKAWSSWENRPRRATLQRVMAAAERKGETTCRLTAEIARWLRGSAAAEAAPVAMRFLPERRDTAGRSCSRKRFCVGAKKPGGREGVFCAETVPLVRKTVAATCVAN